MEVLSNLGEAITISWDNSYFGENQFELWLEEVGSGKAIDMRQKDRWTFMPTSELTPFRLHFGDLSYVQSQVSQLTPWVSTPYPNPFQGYLSNDIFLPVGMLPAKVDFHLYNMLGQEVSTQSLELPMQVSRLKWKFPEARISKGMYMYQIRLATSKGIVVQTAGQVFFDGDK